MYSKTFTLNLKANLCKLATQVKCNYLLTGLQ